MHFIICIVFYTLYVVYCFSKPLYKVEGFHDVNSLSSLFSRHFSSPVIGRQRKMLLRDWQPARTFVQVYSHRPARGTICVLAELLFRAELNLTYRGYTN